MMGSDSSSSGFGLEAFKQALLSPSTSLRTAQLRAADELLSQNGSQASLSFCNGTLS